MQVMTSGGPGGDRAHMPGTGRSSARPGTGGRSAGEAGDAVGEAGGEDRLAAQPVLVGEGLLEPEAEALVDRPAVVDDAGPGERGDLLGELDGGVEGGAVGDDPVDEARCARPRRRRPPGR